jgi:hypothetical protein
LAVTAGLLSTPLAESINQRGQAWPYLEPRTVDFLVALLLPLPFLAIGMLCSLIFRDVLTTVAVAGATTAVVTGAIGTEHWLVIALVVVVVAVVNALLMPRWLREPAGSSWALRLPRLAWPRGAAADHSTLSVRSSVAWRRAAGSLLWKEWRQALGLTLTLAAVVTLGTLARSVIEQVAYRLYSAGQVSFWVKGGFEPIVSVCFTILPLVFGIAAGRADRRDRAYQLLANRGVSPNGYWLAKHAIWMGLALVTSLWALGCERLALHLAPPLAGLPSETLWDFCRTVARDTFFQGEGWRAGFGATLAIVLFVVVLLEALGHLLSVVIPSAMTALVLGLIAWAVAAWVWLVATFLELPFWWTIGLLPSIFLFAGWLRTRDWLVDHNTLAAWGRVAASLVVPLFGICCAAAVFRVVQIPSVTLPLELQAAPTVEPAGSPLRLSLFVNAVKALNGTPPPLAENATPEGWAPVDAPRRAWVRYNERAINLALKASRQERGDFPAAPWEWRPGTFRGEGVLNLQTLLLDSARELESEDKLAEALDNYVAVARLRDDLLCSSQVGQYWQFFGMEPALAPMDRWAAHPKQTSELIKRALVLFQQFQDHSPSDATAVLSAWRKERRLFDDYTSRGNNPDEKTRTAAETGFVRWCLPWELLRLQRLQDLLFATGLDEIQLVDRQLRDRGFVDPALIDTNTRRAPWKWEQTTFMPPIDAVSGGWFRKFPENRVDRAARARLHFLVWAALDYRRQQERLPTELAQLVPTYFDWLPVDPWTGKDFLYEPQGVPDRLVASGFAVQKNEPFVASAGVEGCRIELNTERKFAIDDIQKSLATPVHVVNRHGRDLRGVTLDFPAPILPIPSSVRASLPKTAPSAPVKPQPKQAPPGKALVKPSKTAAPAR